MVMQQSLVGTENQPGIDLGDPSVTVSDWLLYNITKIQPREFSEPGNVSTFLGFDPKDQGILPRAYFKGSGEILGTEKDPEMSKSQGTLGVDWKDIGAERTVSPGSIKDVFRMKKAGPLEEGYYSKEQTGGIEKTGFGGKLRTGPLLFSLDQSQTDQPGDIQDRSRKVGASGSMLLGKGIASAGIGRDFVERKFPGGVQKNPPVTSSHLKWEGGAGPGNLAVAGDLQKIRGYGYQPRAGASYSFPLLGGEAQLGADWTNPLGRDSVANFKAKWGIKW